MQAGRLRHRVTLRERVDTQNSTTGVVTTTWQDFATVWAEVAPLSVREALAAQAAQSRVTVRITIRYMAGLKPSMQIVHGADTYELDGEPLADPKSGREYLTLMASKIAHG